jgi:hypothetical protein
MLLLATIITTLILKFLQEYQVLSNKVWLEYPIDSDNHIVWKIFTAVIFAPLIETLINQSLVYHLLQKVHFFSNHKWRIILFSATFFGVKHFYSLEYIISALVLGIIFMHAYMERVEKDSKTFYLIAASHASFNLIVLLINYFDL